MNAKQKRERIQRMRNALELLRTVWDYGANEGLTTDDLVAFLRLKEYRSLSKRMASFRQALRELGLEETKVLVQEKSGIRCPKRWRPAILLLDAMRALEAEVRRLTDDRDRDHDSQG